MEIPIRLEELLVQKIIPNIWCQGTAAEAVDFYAAALPRASGRIATRYPTEGLNDFQKPLAGQPLTAELTVDGYRFVLINAGDNFLPNSALNFMLVFDPRRESDARASLNAVWDKLIDGGEVMIDRAEQPYSPWYGMLRDRYGVVWQLIESSDTADPRPLVMPSLMFSGAAANRAREAITEYLGLFPDSGLGMLAEYGEAMGAAAPDSVMYADFRLAGQWFVAMDTPMADGDEFTPGVSLQVDCADQAEIDRYWATLSTVPEAEQCGWCADRYGVSWQIVPVGLDADTLTPEAFSALMTMKKIVVAELPGLG